MIVLVFDTETTGLIHKNIEISPETIETLPYILQLSWILYDTQSGKQTEKDVILTCPIPIPSESTKVHGITNKISENGYDISEIIDIFLDDVRECDVLVGHNIGFDLNMLEIELYRLDRDEDSNILFDKVVFDTMLEAKNVLKLPGKHGYKFPTLAECHMNFFEFMFNDAHNALGDVRATLAIYKHLQKCKGIP